MNFDEVKDEDIKGILNIIVSAIERDDADGMGVGLDDLMSKVKPTRGRENLNFAPEIMEIIDSAGAVNCLSKFVDSKYLKQYRLAKFNNGDSWDDFVPMFGGWNGNISSEVLASSILKVVRGTPAEIKSQAAIGNAIFRNASIDVAISYIRQMDSSARAKMDGHAYISLLDSCCSWRFGKNRNQSKDRVLSALDVLIDYGITSRAIDSYAPLGCAIAKIARSSLNMSVGVPHRRVIFDRLFERAEECDFSLRAPDSDGLTMSYYALEIEDKYFLRRLAEEGVPCFDKKHKGDYGYSPLSKTKNKSAWAAAFNAMLSFHGFEQEAGDDLMVMKKLDKEVWARVTSWPRLHAAAYSGFESAVRDFIQDGDDLNSVATLNYVGGLALPYTAFELAIMAGDIPTIRTMMELGADLNGRTAGDKPILSRAKTPEFRGKLRSLKAQMEIEESMESVDAPSPVPRRASLGLL